MNRIEKKIKAARTTCRGPTLFFSFYKFINRYVISM